MLYSFAIDKPPGHKIYKEPTIELFKKSILSVWSQITFYLEDHDQKRVDFIGKIITISSISEHMTFRHCINLDMFRHKNESEVLLLSTTEICETILKQTHTKPHETLEINFTQPKNPFSSESPIKIKAS